MSGGGAGDGICGVFGSGYSGQAGPFLIVFMAEDQAEDESTDQEDI